MDERTVTSLGLKLGQLVRVKDPDETKRRRDQSPTFVVGMIDTIGKTFSISHIVNDVIVTLKNGYNYHVEWVDVELSDYNAFMEILNVL